MVNQPVYMDEPISVAITKMEKLEHGVFLVALDIHFAEKYHYPPIVVKFDMYENTSEIVPQGGA